MPFAHQSLLNDLINLFVTKEDTTSSNESLITLAPYNQMWLTIRSEAECISRLQ